MTEIKTPELSEEDREALTAALKTWKDEGNPNPLIGLDYDVDGDGKLDAWGLDAFGNLILVSGATIDETVYVADGGGVETGGEPI